MDIVLALLRTLIFVVATVAATVYVGRRIGRGHALLWTGSTLMTLHWLISFGWASYQAGSANAPSDAAGWVVWSSSLLPFLAGLAYIWGIGQAAGFPSHTAAAGASPAGPGKPIPDGAAPSAAAGGTGGTPVPAPSQHGTWQPSSGQRSAGSTGHAPRPSGTPAEHHHKPRPRPPGLVVPHAVPVVMTPASHHHSPPDPDPVVDLGPDDDAAPEVAAPPLGTPPIAPAGWAPTGPRPASSPAAPTTGSSSPEGGPQTPS